VSALRILLTGFEPFGGRQTNTSERIIQSLGEIKLDGAEFQTIILPVSARRMPEVFLERLNAFDPQVVLSLGEQGKQWMSVERLAINLLEFDFGCRDNDKLFLRDHPVRPDGPTAYWSTIPVRAICEAISATGTECELSLSADSFICNQAMYLALDWASHRPLMAQAGFLHLPALPDENHRSTIELDRQVKAVWTALRVIVEEHDLQLNTELPTKARNVANHIGRM